MVQLVLAPLLGTTASISVAGIGLTTAAGGLTLAGSIVNLAGGLLLSTAANALLGPDVPNIRPENVQTNSKTATAPRLRHYGVTKVGGNIVFHRASEGISYRLIVHGHGEITRVLGYYLNNESVDLDENGFVTDEQYQHGGRSRVNIQSRLGQIPEAHYQEITDVWSEWTSGHRLDGQWTSLIQSESVPANAFRGMYPADEPALFALAETSKLFDPRDDSTEFSENLALAVADLVSSPDGFGEPDALDMDNIADEADFADDQIALAAGGTEARLRVSGAFGLNEKPQDVLKKMLRAGGGEVRLSPSGKIRLEFARVRTPEFTLEYKHLRQVSNVDAGPDGLDRYNVLPGRFVSHDLNHIEVDAEAWRDEERIVADGDELVAGEAYQVLLSPSHRQTRAAMKVEMERANPKQRLQVLCGQAALPAAYESVINLDVPELRLSGKYEVKGHNFLLGDKGLLQGVELTLHLIDDAAFTLALDEQGAVQELPPPDTSAGLPGPENVVASGSGVQIAQNAFAAGVGVAWEAPPSDALTPVLKYSDADADEWTEVVVAEGATSHTISGLTDGADYDVSLAWQTPGEVIGPDAVIEDVTATADATPPATPTGLNVTDNGDSTALVEVTTSASAGLWKTEIYRDAALIGVIYAAPATAISLADDCGAGTFDWTARSVNVSNINSDSDAGPFTATIT